MIGRQSSEDLLDCRREKKSRVPGGARMIVAPQRRRVLRSLHVATAFFVDGRLIALADALQDRRPHACKTRSCALREATRSRLGSLRFSSHRLSIPSLNLFHSEKLAWRWSLLTRDKTYIVARRGMGISSIIISIEIERGIKLHLQPGETAKQ